MDKQPRQTSEILQETLALLETNVARGTHQPQSRNSEAQTATGFNKVDTMLGEFSEGTVILVTSDLPEIAEHFLYQIASNIARNADRKVLLYSPQKPAHAVMQNMLALRGGISLAKFETGDFSAEDFSKLYEAVKTFATNNITMNDDAHKDLDGVVQETKEFMKNKKVDVVFASKTIDPTAEPLSKFSSEIRRPLILSLATPNPVVEELATVVISLKKIGEDKIVAKSRVSKNGRTEFFNIQYERECSRLTQML
jgi:hypothetical protein